MVDTVLTDLTECIDTSLQGNLSYIIPLLFVEYYLFYAMILPIDYFLAIGAVDVLLFNPPYVPTPSEEVVHPSQDGCRGYVAHSQTGGATVFDSICTDDSIRSPYLPTTDITAAWAGGLRGREVIDRFIPTIEPLLSVTGLCYMVLVKENQPEEKLKEG